MSSHIVRGKALIPRELYTPNLTPLLLLGRHGVFKDALIKFLALTEATPYMACGKRMLSAFDVAEGSQASELDAIHDRKQTLQERIAFAGQTHGVGSPECREASQDLAEFKALWMTVASQAPGIHAYLYAPNGPLVDVFPPKA